MNSVNKNPREGDMHFDKNSNEIKVYHNKKWYNYFPSSILEDYYLMEERKQKLEKIKQCLKKEI